MLVWYSKLPPHPLKYYSALGSRVVARPPCFVYTAKSKEGNSAAFKLQWKVYISLEKRENQCWYGKGINIYAFKCFTSIYLWYLEEKYSLLFVICPKCYWTKISYVLIHLLVALSITLSLSLFIRESVGPSVSFSSSCLILFRSVLPCLSHPVCPVLLCPVCHVLSVSSCPVILSFNNLILNKMFPLNFRYFNMF